MDTLWVETCESVEIVGWDSLELFTADNYRVFPGFGDLKEGKADDPVNPVADAASKDIKPVQPKIQVLSFLQNGGGKNRHSHYIDTCLIYVPYL